MDIFEVDCWMIDRVNVDLAFVKIGLRRSYATDIGGDGYDGADFLER
jgi:hypothetical protein